MAKVFSSSILNVATTPRMTLAATIVPGVSSGPHVVGRWHGNFVIHIALYLGKKGVMYRERKADFLTQFLQIALC